MRALTYESKMEALELYLTGISADAVAAQTGISKGAVISIIKDAREGTIPYPTLKGRVDELHRLSVRLNKQGMDVPQARLGFSLLETLQKMNIEPDNVKKWAEFCLNLSPTPPGDFVPAAVALFQLEKETGKSYGELASEVKSLTSQRAALAAEVQSLQTKEAAAKKLAAEIQSGSKEVSKLRAEKEVLERAVSSLTAFFQKEAKRLGIASSHLEERATEMATLEGEINEKSRRKDVLDGEIEALSARHARLSAQMEKASADFAKDVDSMKKMRAELARIAAQKGKYEERVRNMAFSTDMFSFLLRPDTVEDPNLDLIDMVINCVDKWIAAQRLLVAGARMGTLKWAEVKGSVEGRRMARKRFPQ